VTSDQSATEGFFMATSSPRQQRLVAGCASCLLWPSSTCV